jgi:RND superfamily putative drug exporter
MARVADQLRNVPGVTAVVGPLPSPDGRAALLQAIPSTAPQDAATSALIRHLRRDVLPTATAGTGLQLHIGGETALYADFAKILSGRLPWFFAIVLGCSFLLLLVVFRSLLVPLKAVVMNLLSIGAAYRVLVAIFQWGWLSKLVGVGRNGPIESWAPMMLFAVVFGLSMDYEVFLLSRI